MKRTALDARTARYRVVRHDIYTEIVWALGSAVAGAGALTLGFRFLGLV